jgi:hypothetical protein
MSSLCDASGVTGTRREFVLAFPARTTPLRSVRSTLLMGSIAGLRANGHFEAWSAIVPESAREELLRLVAGVWVPVETAMAHYRACDSLRLSSEEQARLGGATFARVRGTLLGTMLKLGNGAGVTPWTLMPHLQRFWDRAYEGAAIQVLRVGPKDAHLDVAECPFAEVRYYRNALRGLLVAVLDLFCDKAYMQERAGARAPGTIAFRAQWA